ncbi:universal stress protein (plasmid) [Salinigranum rubrum]|uniref:Universal stress protein n=1 Tax=Salinigranum rubrum TaxID=755307 RepID=A0A2I8VQB3_9EURY|nr:universal stress protein [Salinigranum rubrum]AUV84117.1 universal stress protein [Salinigranum rubrum]
MVVLRHVAVPVANDEDVVETAAALEPYLDEIHRATLIHVIETRPGAVNKAPMEKRRDDAREFLSVFESRLDGRVIVDTRIVFGADVAETIVETADAVEATVIIFRSRGSGRLARLLTGNTTARLVNDPELPVLSLAEEQPHVLDSIQRTKRPDVEGT